MAEQRGQLQAVGQTAYQIELLAALAKTVRAALVPEGDKKGRTVVTARDLPRAKALLPGLLKDLASRSGLLSFKQLSSALASLAVLLPVLQAAPPPEAAALVAALPVAARNTSPPPPSSALMEAFSAALQIYRLPGAALQDGPMMPPAVAQQLREYLASALLGTPGRGQGQGQMQPRAGAEMAELAAAVTLVRLYVLPQPPAWVEGVAARVQQLVVEATPAAEPLDNSRMERAGTKASAEGGDVRIRRSGQESLPRGSGSLNGTDGDRQSPDATGKRKERRGRWAIAAGTSRGADLKGSGASADGSAKVGLSERACDPKSQQPNQKSQPGRRRTGVSSDEVRLSGDLDVQSLEMLLTAWLAAPPPPPPPPTSTPSLTPTLGPGAPVEGPGNPEVDIPFDWPSWASRVLEQAWLTQDPATQERRGALLARWEALDQPIEELRQELAIAERAARAEGASDAQAGRSVCTQGGGGPHNVGVGVSARGKKGRGDRGGRSPAGSTGVGRVGSGSDQAAPSSSGQQAQARVAELGAQISGLCAKRVAADKELSGLGPSCGAELMDAEAVVRLAFASSRCLGGRCGPRVGELAERVLSSRLGDMEQQPRLIIWSLSALRHMRHPCRPELVASSLQLLQPRLSGLAVPDAMELMEALQAFSPAPPNCQAPRDILLPLAQPLLAAYSGSAPSAATEYAMALLPLSAAWGVPLAPETLALVGRLADRRVRMEVDEHSSPLLFRSLAESKRYMVETAEATVSPPAGGGSRAGGGGGRFMERLLERVILPLCELRQHLDNYEAFMAALNCWLADRGLAALTARKATLLLGTVAAAASWPHVPMLRKDLESLMVAVLREEWLLAHGLGAEELAPLLLAAAQAMRVMASKVVRRGGIAEDAAPRAAPLVLPAVEWLLALQPGPDQLATAMKALFVELEWDPRQAAAETLQQAAGGTSTSSSPSASIDPGSPPSAAQRPPPHLLERMLAMAEASLQPQPRAVGEGGNVTGGCSAEAAAFILEACARWDHLPPPGLLDQVYGAALAAVQARAPQAAVVVSLVDSISRLDALAAGDAREGANQGSSSGDIGGSNVAGTGATSLSRGLPYPPPARSSLLEALAGGLTQDTALRVLSQAPGKLVGAVRQLALMGVRPSPAWVDSYTGLVQGLMSGLTAQGLAHTAAGLALLGASPPGSWVDSLLVEAERRVAGAAGRGGPAGGGAVASSWQRFDSYDLGLLLGAVHALWGRSGRLSDAAEAAWGRAHVTFVSGALGCMSRYRAVELQLVVAAVAAYELRRPFLGGTSAGAAPAKGAPPSGRGGAKLSAVDYMGRVEPEWLEACGGALMEGRRRRLKEAGGEGGPAPSAAAELPSAPLLLDLLRLASRVVYGSPDGTIRRLAEPTASSSAGSCSGNSGTAGGAESTTGSTELRVTGLVRYVDLSLADWAAVEQGGGGSGLSVADWADLLTGSLDAGIAPPGAALEAYCGKLFPALQAGVEKENQQQGRGGAGVSGGEADPSDHQRHQAVWAAAESALVRVLLRVLPWSPPDPLSAAFRDGFLAAVPLERASMRQLALLSIFCTQADMINPREFWPRLRQELMRRAALALQGTGGAPPAVSKPGVSGMGNKGSADDRQSGEAPVVVKSPAVGKNGTSKVRATPSKQLGGSGDGQPLMMSSVADAAAGDLTAVLYGLEVSGCGCGVGSASEDPMLAEWLAQLLTPTALSAATANRNNPAVATTPSTARSSQQSSRGSSEYLSGSLAALASLQRLWVERCLRESLPPSKVRALQATRLAAFDGPNALKLLLPAQLQQLVLVCEDAAVGAGANAEAGPMQVSPQLDPGVATALVRQLAMLARSPGGLDPAVAAAALIHLVPRPRYTLRSEGGVPLSLDEMALVQAADAGLLDMPLERLTELLEALEERSGWRLPLRRLEEIVGRLRSKVDVQVQVHVASAAGVEETHEEAETACRWPLGRCLRVTRAMLLLSVAHQRSGADVSAGERGAVLAAVVPWLAHVFPDAEERVQAQALAERLSRTVRATGAAVAENVYLQFWKVAGFAVAFESARAASTTLSAAACVLLQQALHPDPGRGLCADSPSSPRPPWQDPTASSSNRSSPQEGIYGDALACTAERTNIAATNAARDADFRLSETTTAALPKEAAIDLLDALIAAGGDAPLPQPLAAVALLLLGLDGVAAGVPLSRLQQAVSYSLRSNGGREPLPMCEGVVAALEPRLKLLGSSWPGGQSPIAMARELRLSGASAVVSHRAIIDHLSADL